jgi:hypothetical protein
MFVVSLIRKIDQVVDHCLQCHNLDADIGKGAPDLTKARKQVSRRLQSQLFSKRQNETPGQIADDATMV